MCVGPGHGRVAVLLRPVAVPAGGAVVALRGVVVAFAVAAHVEDFVLGIGRGGGVEGGDLVGEALPLGLAGGGGAAGVGGVRAVDEAEVGGGEVEGAGVGGGICGSLVGAVARGSLLDVHCSMKLKLWGFGALLTILEEISGHCGIVDIRIDGGEKAEANGPAREAGQHSERKGQHGQRDAGAYRGTALTYLICTFM